MKNSELKKELKKYGIPYWRIAERIGVSEMTVLRWLRSDNETSHQSVIISAFEELKAGEVNE